MNTLNNLDTFLDVAAHRFSYSDNNAIALDLIEQYKCNQYDSIGSLISDIEMAHCAAGSFNDMIYTRDIERKLCDSDWIDAIDAAIEDYKDNIGETPTFERVTDMVTFAGTGRVWHDHDLCCLRTTKRQRLSRSAWHCTR